MHRAILDLSARLGVAQLAMKALLSSSGLGIIIPWLGFLFDLKSYFDKQIKYALLSTLHFCLK